MESSLSDQAYEAIKGDILSCLLEPGSHIAQSQLAQRYEIGLMPIREALQRLAHEGFVESIPRLGYVVTPITLSDVYEIYELRSILEPAAAALAVERASQEQLDQILEIAESVDFTYLYGDHQSYSAFLERDTLFHLSIALATRNQRLVDIFSRLLDELKRIFYLSVAGGNYAEEIREGHLALAKTLCERDSDHIGQVFQEQLAHSLQRTLNALEHRASSTLALE
jgi:DNA-binding GntR family transcriptional regulator